MLYYLGKDYVVGVIIFNKKAKELWKVKDKKFRRRCHE